MRNSLCLVAVGIICVLASGCAGPYESVVEEHMSLLKEANVILTGVEDAASLEAAKPALQALGLKMKDAADRLKNLEAPSKDKEEFLKAQYEEESREVANELLSHLTRIGSMKGGADIGQIFKGAVPKDPAPKE